MSPDAAHRSQSQLIAEVLLRKGVLTRDQLEQAAAQAKSKRRSLGHSLVSLGLIPTAALLQLLSAIYKVRAADVSRITRIPSNVLASLSAGEAKRNLALPLRKTDGKLTVAVANPADQALLGQLREVSGLEIEPVVAPDFALFDAIKKYYKPERDPATAISTAAPASRDSEPRSPSTPNAQPAVKSADTARSSTDSAPASEDAGPASVDNAPASSPAAPPERATPTSGETVAVQSMLGLDRLRGMDLSAVLSGKGLLLAGVTSIVLGAIVTTLSYEPTGEDASYFITMGLLFVGIAAIMRGFFTLDD